MLDRTSTSQSQFVTGMNKIWPRSASSALAGRRCLELDKVCTKAKLVSLGCFNLFLTLLLTVILGKLLLLGYDLLLLFLFCCIHCLLLLQNFVLLLFFGSHTLVSDWLERLFNQNLTLLEDSEVITNECVMLGVDVNVTYGQNQFINATLKTKDLSLYDIVSFLNSSELFFSRVL